MNFHLTVGDWPNQKKDARAIRYDVFVVEQSVPVELEWDDMDAQCLHVLAYDEQGRAIGTGRLLPDGHIGRMAVQADMRDAGVGSAILTALMQQAKQRGDRMVMLNAQIHAAPFYQRHGFVQEGETFMEAGILHIAMRHDF